MPAREGCAERLVAPSLTSVASERAAVRFRSEISCRHAAHTAASSGLSAPHFGHRIGSRLADIGSMTEEPLSLSDTARGIAIRAGLLTVGGILIGGWLFGVLMKVAGKTIHLLLAAGVALLIGGVATYEVKKLSGTSRSKWRQRQLQPQDLQ